MFRQLSFAVLLLALGQIANGQIASSGSCPVTNTIEDFDVSKYIGLWYQYAAYPFIYTSNTKCTSAKYGVINSTTVSVENVSINKATNQTDEIKGTATVVGPGSLAVVFFEGQSTTKSNYKVVATDYNSYAVVYTCESNILKLEFLWILTRERFPSEETIATALQAAKDNGISTTQLRIEDQSDCTAVVA